MPILNDISGGQISGTGILLCPSGILGEVNIVADGTNACTVVIRENDSSGRIVYQTSTKSPFDTQAPRRAARNIYYSITGTGGTAQIFEWID